MVFCHLDSTWHCKGFHERGALQAHLVLRRSSSYSLCFLPLCLFILSFSFSFVFLSSWFPWSCPSLLGSCEVTTIMAVFPILLVFLLKLITLALPTAGSQFKSVGMFDTWSVPHMLPLKVSENVCSCHCYSNHLQFFFVTLFWVGFLFLPVHWCVCWIQVFYSLIIRSSLNSMQVDLKL
jgi:hypothetical protein